MKKLGFWALILGGLLAAAVPAIVWGFDRGVTGVAVWILIVVAGGLAVLLLDVLGSTVLELAAGWVGSRLPHPVRDGLGKQIGGPLMLLGLLSVLAAVLIALTIWAW